MATSRQLRRLATNPADYVRFLQTGRLPQGVRPQSPLIDVLQRLNGLDLVAIRGLVVDQRLGYSGSRTFDTAAQALLWARPSDEVFGNYPAASYQDQRFTRRLRLSEVLDCARSFPERLAKAYAALD